MAKAERMVIVERSTYISKEAYYFTKNGIFRLEGYSNLVSYFLLLCLALLAFRAFEGQVTTSIIIAVAIVLLIFAFMILWVYPKERRISEFSLAEIRHESSAKNIPWKSISKATLRRRKLTFWEGEG